MTKRAHILMIFSVTIIMGLTVSCKKKASPKESPHLEERKSNGTMLMAEKLLDLAKPSTGDLPTFRNTERAADFLRQVNETQENGKKIELFYYHCKELVNAGKTEQGIKAIEGLMKQTGNTLEGVNESTKPFYELLALAYLRLGEQKNCITNHNSASCILPLQKAGMHADKTGSEKAINIYTGLLKKFPNEPGYVWLMNLAYMTLGGHPDLVPANYLLPPSLFRSKGFMPPFANMATELGIDTDGLSGGVCMEDFNNDGFTDLVVSSWGLKDQVRFYTNNGDGTFSEKTKEAGLTGITGGLNMIHADYDNDGWADILILRGAWLLQAGNHPNSLLRNLGNGKFEDVTMAAGIYSEHPTQTAVWADFNLDGHLDLFIGNESGSNFSNPCEMYFNNGDGTFTQVAEKLGLDINVYAKGVAAGDVDNNGYPDLYISVFGGKNLLFVNKGGSGPDHWVFEESAANYGVEGPFWSFPTWFFDFDNDGLEDLFVASYDFERFNTVADEEVMAILGLPSKAEQGKLYRNMGNGRFKDVSKESGFNRTYFAMGSNHGDINNDGYPDIYLGTGVPHLSSTVPNRLFLNQGGKGFNDVTFDAVMGHIQKGHGIAFGDMDNDGDQDVYCVLGGAYEGDNFRNAFFVNPGNGNKWVSVKLEGTSSNRCAIGAMVRVEIREQGKKRTVYHRVGTGGSFGASPLRAEIGLGNTVTIEKMTVFWPNGARSEQTFENLQLNTRYILKEGGEPIIQNLKQVTWQADLKIKHHH